MSNDQSPWSRPDPRWEPQHYRDVRGRDPLQPFGAPPSPSPPSSIDDFRAPRRGRAPWWLLIVAVLAAVALLLVALQLIGGEPDPESPVASPTPSLSTPTAPAPTPVPGSSIPFEGNGTGTFTLLTESWDDSGVTITFRVEIDSGRGEFAVYLFGNDSMAVNDPLDLTTFQVAEGEPATLAARFEVPRGPGTLVLASAYGQALTALPVRG